MTERQVEDMTADELRGIARKLTTYARIYTGDKEAWKRLGHDEIECFILPQGGEKEAVDAEIASLDENLIRGRLDDAELSLLMARRKELYEVQFPETKAGGDRKSAKAKSNAQNAREKDSFATSTAKATGKHPATIRRAVARGTALGAETLTRIKGTSLAKGVEQDALAKLPPEQREPIIARAEAGEPVSARERKFIPRPLDRVGLDLCRLRKAWDVACDEARAQFKTEIA